MYQAKLPSWATYNVVSTCCCAMPLLLQLQLLLVKQHVTFRLIWQIALGSNSVTADYYGESTSWGDDDPSVFVVTKVLELQGEYQICNGYGTAKATPILRVRYLTTQGPHLS